MFSKLKPWHVRVFIIILMAVFITGVSGCGNAGGSMAASKTSQDKNNPAPTAPVDVDIEQPVDDEDDSPVEPVDRQQDFPTPDSSETRYYGTFIPPDTGYWIEVSVTEQIVRIFQDGSLQKEWIASTGTPEKPTPLGVFNIQNRGEWFFSSKYGQGAKWWVSFKDWGVYLFHTVPMNQEQEIIVEEAEKLGSPASHGCVRLEVDHAKWIYDNIPQGTPVYIH